MAEMISHVCVLCDCPVEMGEKVEEVSLGFKLPMISVHVRCAKVYYGGGNSR